MTGHLQGIVDAAPFGQNKDENGAGLFLQLTALSPKDNSLKKILLIIGSRPDVIKMAPLVFALRTAASHLESRICDTNQHTGLKEPILRFFELQPDYSLGPFAEANDISSFVSEALRGLETVIADFSPDWVLVHGDTSTAFAGALAAFYAGVRVGHVEAGLRTPMKRSPFPEEMNRRLIGQLTDLHFCPTLQTMDNLRKEGVPDNHLVLCGNTIVDALQWALAKIDRVHLPEVEAIRQLLSAEGAQNKKKILLTLHRRENLDRYLADIGEGIRRIAEHIPCSIFFPVHRNPRVVEWAGQFQEELPDLILLPPLPYEAFISLMKACDLILTDSGGIQEEAPTLGKKAILLRETTERPEATHSGAVLGVTVDAREIEHLARAFFEKGPFEAAGENPFGDGHAAEKIISRLL